jgi:hypothetical protein
MGILLLLGGLVLGLIGAGWIVASVAGDPSRSGVCLSAVPFWWQ